MRIFFLLGTISLLFCATALAQVNAVDGLYLLKEGVRKPELMADGHWKGLGAKRDIKVTKAYIISQSNANDRFYLGIHVPYDKELDEVRHVLLVDGQALLQSSSGSSNKSESTLGFEIDSLDRAIAVGRYFKTYLSVRAHPKYNLRVSIKPEKTEYVPGEPVRAALEVENVGQTEFAFMKGGRNRAGRDNQYVFAAYMTGKQVADVGTTMNFGGLAVRKVVRPGEVFRDTIDLGKWFAFDKPGLYELIGTYHMEFVPVTGDGFQTIWEDNISAEFFVNVREK
jgi:hypothetical protein